MVCFEFEISVVLAICVPVSCVVLWFTTRAKEGGVKLPVHVGEEVTRNADAGGYLSGDDPFDVTKPEDIIDGYPIDEDGFWKRVSKWYLFSSVLPNLSFFFFFFGLDATVEAGHVSASHFCGRHQRFQSWMVYNKC